MNERRWWWHWQNLSLADKKGRLPLHGRAWLHFGSESLSVEWNLLSKSCGISLAAGDERTWSASVKLPPIALYFGAELRKERLFSRLAKKLIALSPSDMNCTWSGRRLDVSVHDWSIWWHLWVDDSGWTSKRPKWRDGSFNIPDFFLGKQSYESRLFDAKDITVCMPEGKYVGRCELREDTWTRPRGRTRYVMRAHVEMKQPIPVPGKGENSWDCDEDAIHGSTFPAMSFAQAITEMTRSALRDRERRGGLDWTPEATRGAA